MAQFNGDPEDLERNGMIDPPAEFQDDDGGEQGGGQQYSATFRKELTISKERTQITAEDVESAARRLEVLGMAVGFMQGLEAHMQEYTLTFADGGTTVKTTAEQFVDCALQVADWLVG